LDQEYQEAKVLVDERQAVANEKAYNKASSDSAKAAAVVAEIKVRDTAAKAAVTAATKVKTDADTVRTTLNNIYLADESNADNRAAVNKQDIVVYNAQRELDAATRAADAVATELSTAEGLAATALATYTAAQKVKDATARKAKEAARLAIKQAYDGSKVER
jgi:hypothetical protein